MATPVLLFFHCSCCAPPSLTFLSPQAVVVFSFHGCPSCFLFSRAYYTTAKLSSSEAAPIASANIQGRSSTEPIASQKNDRLRNFFRCSQASEGNASTLKFEVL